MPSVIKLLMASPCLKGFDRLMKGPARSGVSRDTSSESSSRICA